MMVTAKGTVKKLELRSFGNVRKTGIIAITLEGDDWLKKSRPVNPGEEVIIVSKMGQAIRFNETDIRITGRSSKGVIGIRLDIGDQVIGMEVEEPETALLCVSENGYGKCTEFDTFRLIKRGGKGVRAMNINEKSGTVIGCRVVRADEHLFIITVKGQTIRITTSQIPQLGRYATGVRLIKLEEGDKVISITRMGDPGSPPVDDAIVDPDLLENQQ
jgi:DNA gyrase subunit A